jgi:hypothetical protein
MTKQRQRERKKRLRMASGAKVSAREERLDENVVKEVDALFRHLAEQSAAESDASIEDALDGTWALFEAGFTRLVAHDDEVGIEPCRDRAEQRAQTKRNRPLVELRRRLLAETEGGTGEPH